MKPVSFDTTKKDARLIKQIATRAMKRKALKQLAGGERIQIEMDITAVHANGCPLRLKDFLEAPSFDFSHDIVGIRRHLNRDTGQLEDCFLPRYTNHTSA